MSSDSLVVKVPTYNKIRTEAQHPDNALVLYMFYCERAKTQGTNQPWATKPFCMKGLGWSSSKFSATKRDLVNLGLIQRIPAHGQKEKEYTKIIGLGLSGCK